MVSLGGTSLSAVIAQNDDELMYGDQTRIVVALSSALSRGHFTSDDLTL
jgi:hypothetical protein